MERFGTTRHKVRRAFVELVSRGLVTQERNKGSKVRDYSREEVEELYEIRNTLQSRAIRRMPLPVSDGLIDRLRDVQAAHARASHENALEEMFQLNNEFHELFFSACGSKLLAEAIRDYAWRTHLIRSQGFFDVSYREEAIEDHHMIVEALAKGDRDALVEVNLRHINRPRDLYLRTRP